MILDATKLPDPLTVHEEQKEQHTQQQQDNTTSLCNACRFAFRRSCADRWDGEPELEITCCAPWLKAETRNTFAVSACNGFVEGELLQAPHLTKSLDLEGEPSLTEVKENNEPILPPVNPPAPAQSGEGEGTDPIDPAPTVPVVPPPSGSEE